MQLTLILMGTYFTILAVVVYFLWRTVQRKHKIEAEIQSIATKDSVRREDYLLPPQTRERIVKGRSDTHRTKYR